MNHMLEQYRSDLIAFLKNKYTFHESIQSAIPCLNFNFASAPSKLKNIMYNPCLCIILQGKKAVGFGDKMYSYDPYTYLLTSTHIPADIQILEASQNEPYMSLTIQFTLEDIYQVLKHTNPEKLKFQQKSEQGLFFDALTEKLYDPVFRLVRLLDQPKEDIAFLSPLFIKEILYVLVNDKSGYFLNKFAMEGTISNKIVKVITEIRDHFTEKLNIAQLAKHVDISESSLYQNFKTITSVSPLQFQKNLRLEEAKQMLMHRHIDISEIAFSVGYESPSQFSREYSRMFGLSPKEHLKILRASDEEKVTASSSFHF